MFARLSRSWTLVKASASVLSQNKEMLLFPLISSIAVLLVALSFALPMFAVGAFDALTASGDDSISALGYVIAFLFYFSQYFVIFFFNTALVGAAMMRLDGKEPTFGDGMRIATSKVGHIAGYALIAATVGMILRAIEERVGFLGRIIVGLIGLGWTFATYLVVPVLVTRDVGPIEAVKESATLFKKTWGESVIGQGGMGFAFGLITIGVVFLGLFLIVLAIISQSIALIVLTIALTIIAVILVALISSALSGIYSAALYRYATTGEATQGFDANVMQAAFKPKK
jgi:hypothetical protein